MRKLIHRIHRRLVTTSGETLVETLAGILVITLSCAMLMTATVSAATINGKAEQANDERTQERQDAEASTGTGTAGTVRFGGMFYDVTYYGGSTVVGYEGTTN